MVRGEQRQSALRSASERLRSRARAARGAAAEPAPSAVRLARRGASAAARSGRALPTVLASLRAKLPKMEIFELSMATLCALAERHAMPRASLSLILFAARSWRDEREVMFGDAVK